MTVHHFSAQSSSGCSAKLDRHACAFRALLHSSTYIDDAMLWGLYRVQIHGDRRNNDKESLR
jgi:hypothetical protein